jgi:hypothetical protein
MSAALFAALALIQADSVPPFSVRVDPDTRAVVVRLGPFRLPAMDMSHHQGPGMHHEHAFNMPVYRFTWPAGGLIRGFRLRMFDADGKPLSRRLLHHVNLIHLDRRQLPHAAVERTMAAGQETEDVILPRSVGVRIDAGEEMGLLTGWSNETGAELPGVIMELEFPRLPDRLVPRPLEVRPVAFDVGFNAGLPDAFDLEPGRNVHQREFVLPLSGRFLGIGGHLHDYARSLELIDAETGKVLVSLRPRLDQQGKLLSVSRKLFGVNGDGLRLEAGRRYRVVVVYDNPTGQKLEQGGMAVLGGIFAPDDMADWPAVNRNDPTYLGDYAELEQTGWAVIPPGKGTTPPRK